MYGAGDGGPDGWPVQAAASPESTFLDRLAPTDADPVPFDDPERDATRIVEALDGSGHLVAHSGGAVAALLAAAQAPGAVRSLTLFEPACLGLARGRPAVEEMVAAMTAVFDRSADPELTDGEFTHHFLLAMGVPGTDPADPEYAAVGARLRLQHPAVGDTARPRGGLPGADPRGDGWVERGLRRGGRGARRRRCTSGRRAGHRARSPVPPGRPGRDGRVPGDVRLNAVPPADRVYPSPPENHHNEPSPLRAR